MQGNKMVATARGLPASGYALEVDGRLIMVEPLRHRQTKGAATDMFYLTPPRHISTLPITSIWRCQSYFRFSPDSRRSSEGSACLKGAINGCHPHE
jgi:hypothetical protein